MKKSNRKQASETAELTSPSAKDDALVLSEVLLECFGRLVREDRKDMEANVTALGELMNSHVDTELEGTRRSIAQQKRRTDQLCKDFTQSVEQFDSVCEAFRLDYDTLQTSLTKQGTEIGNSLQSLERRLGSSVDSARGSLESMGQKCQRRHSEVVGRLDQWDSKALQLEARISSSESMVKAQDSKWHACTAGMDQLQAGLRLAGETIDDLRRELQTATQRIGELEHSLAQKPTVSSWARRLFLRLGVFKTPFPQPTANVRNHGSIHEAHTTPTPKSSDRSLSIH